ncbi:unnamed protein product [Oppiella nova]|uniref:Uncharacterized protein n=1 Tax=Oppiella nova TaxID=334625 RepID=A0A7R9LM92_9ACAR|nr:unnamed protein product [Oppiella nova]CAG2164991.1 unnamed protein product [Oppiella nova]
MYINASIYYDINNDDYEEVKNSRNFTGKVVLVTGSSSGIGEGIVKLFSILGAHVVVTGRRADEVHKVAQEVQKVSPKGLKPLAVIGDLTKTEDLEGLVNQTIDTFGQLDVLVNNAGISLSASIRDANFTQTFDQIFNVNLRAGLQLIQLTIPYLQHTNGTIISTSSIASYLPRKAQLAYGASKAAVDYATKALAVELGPNIRVNAINPGAILTEPLRKLLTPEELAAIASVTPLKRIGQPLDIAKGVAFLASTDAQFITGANLVIDGGLVI